MNKRVIKTAIIISWIVLVVCFLIKILGGKWFNIVTTNETFISVCKVVDEQLWLRYVIAFITNLIIAVLLNLAVLKQAFLTAKQAAILLPITILSFAVIVVNDLAKNTLIETISFAIGIIPLCICPIILSRKPFRSIVAFILYAVFQAISVMVKGLAITKINDDSTLVGLIFSIDVYIMLILYYLYANKSRKKTEDKI